MLGAVGDQQLARWSRPPAPRSPWSPCRSRSRRHVAASDRIAFLDIPFGELALLHGGRKLRHEDLRRHGSDLSARCGEGLFRMLAVEQADACDADLAVVEATRLRCNRQAWSVERRSSLSRRSSRNGLRSAGVQAIGRDLVFALQQPELVLLDLVDADSRSCGRSSSRIPSPRSRQAPTLRNAPRRNGNRLASSPWWFRPSASAPVADHFTASTTCSTEGSASRSKFAA